MLGSERTLVGFRDTENTVRRLRMYDQDELLEMGKVKTKQYFELDFLTIYIIL